MTTDLANITLAKGAHHDDDDGCDDPERCFWEWYNWLGRHKHTDARPPGVSPVLHAFGMRLNDCLPDAKRQELKRFLPNGTDRLAGTADDGKDETRALIAANWALRTGARTWLAAAGMDDETAAIDAIAPITTPAELSAAVPAIQAIRNRLWDKRAATYTSLRAQVRAKLAETKPAVEVAVAAAVAGAVEDAVAGAGAVEGAVAGAVAGADAVAGAVADAGAAAGAVEDAVAAAGAGAVADAVAVAGAVADAVAVAGAVAGAGAAAAAVAAAAWRGTYSKAYNAAYPVARKAVEDKYGPAIAEIQDSAIALYDVLITGEWPAAQ